jgi:hypothetical protein
MGQTEAPANQATPRKHPLDLFGGGVGGHIEVLGMLAQQQITHTAANNVSLITCILQIAYDFSRVRAQLLNGDPVFRCRNGN